MRVAIVMPVYFEDDLAPIGGGDRYPYKLALAMNRSCDITLVSFGPRQRTIERDEGLHHVVLTGGGRDPYNPRPSLGYFLRERFDLIHVHQLRSLVTTLLTGVCSARRTPLVVTDHGGGGPSLMYRLQLYRLIHSFILVSDFSRKMLPPRIWSRVRVVKGGVDLQRFPFIDAPRLNQVVYVGRIMPHKGINYLLDAAGPDIPVVVAGKVVDAAYYEDLRRQSLGKPVTFVTDASDEFVKDLYSQSAVTVAASVYRDIYGREWSNSELQGTPLLESMAVGTPVVCTEVGGMPEHVLDGVTGYVVPPNDSQALRDKLKLLIGDSRRASEMGRAGHEHVKAFTWQHVAEQVCDEYSNTLRSHRL